MDPLNQSDNSENSISVDPNKNYLEELVGEDRKFKSPEELARGKAEADAFILRLQNELAGVRNELKDRTTMTEFMETIKNSRSEAPPNNQQEERQEDKSSPLTPEAVKEQFDKLLSEREVKSRKEQNYREVLDTLNASFGADSQRVLQEKARELGMNLNNLKRMAEESPKAFLTLVGATGQRQPSEADLFSAPPQTRVNSTTTRSNPNERTFSAYEKIRKADPNRYWTPAVQNALFRGAERLGDRFYDT